MGTNRLEDAKARVRSALVKQRQEHDRQMAAADKLVTATVTVKKSVHEWLLAAGYENRQREPEVFIFPNGNRIDIFESGTPQIGMGLLLMYSSDGGHGIARLSLRFEPALGIFRLIEGGAPFDEERFFDWLAPAMAAPAPRGAAPEPIPASHLE